jgi:hypothetical protein
VPSPYLHKFSAVVQIMHYFGAIWENLHSIDAGTAPSRSAIPDKFSEQH